MEPTPDDLTKWLATEAERVAILENAFRERRFSRRWIDSDILAMSPDRLRAHIARLPRMPEWLGDLAEIPDEHIQRAAWSGEYEWAKDDSSRTCGWRRRKRRPS